MQEQNKKQIGICIPRDLDEQLEKHVAKIGISKPAFILGLIYKELERVTNLQVKMLFSGGE